MIKRKQPSDFTYYSVVNDLEKTTFSKSHIEAEKLDQAKNVGMSFVIGLSFCLCFRLRLEFH